MKKKLELTLVCMLVLIIFLIITWSVLPNTYIRDGEFTVTKIGLMRPIHMIVYYYVIKLYLTRFGYFMNKGNICSIAIAVALVFESAFRILSYIRSGQCVTVWWTLGVISIVLIVAFNYIDDVLYEVKYEAYEEK